MKRLLLNLALLCSVALTVPAQTSGLFPNTSYDPAIPTLKSVVGHDWGERITMHHEMEKYVHALAQASNGRAKLFRYGETWEGKSLYYLVIGSPENIARLDAIKAAMQKLADPRTTTDAEVNSLVSSMPVLVWLAYSVHGNEISSTDAALMTAYHLLAAQGEAIAAAARRDVLVIIDPMQNPDGRDRFINYFRQTMGRWPDADTQSAEHNEVWPSGRVNHYLFDMNRDWFAQSQPETQGRTKAYLAWFPQVFVDLHEMGSNSSYYFAPPALPWNPNLTRTQTEWLTKFGRNNAKWFDQFRFDYFTREGYDSFYPGYGEGWPMFHGSIGMTYENASVRGLLVRRSDETTRSYRDSTQYHFVSSLSTIEQAAQNRTALLKYFADFRKSGIEEGKSETVKEYIITPGRDPNRAAYMAATLMKSGIEVRRADAAFTNAKTRDYFDGAVQQREFPAGSYIVSLAQPAKRLLKTLMDKHTPQDREFVEEQREHNRKRQREEFYDVTAWALPYLYDVPCYMTEQESQGRFTMLRELPQPKGSVRGEAKLAYLIPWGTQSAAAALADLFRQEVRVHSNDKAFRLNGTDFPPGTLIVKVKDNPADLSERMQKLAVTHGLEIQATDSSWVDSGSNFGSNNVRYLMPPKIALAWNAPTSPNSAGWTRYVLEQRYGCRVTVIRTEQLRGVDLTKYNVLILPDSFGGYSGTLGDGAKLKEWVQQGGTLISLANATSWLSDDKVKLLPVKREKRAHNDAKNDKDKKETPEPAVQSRPGAGRAQPQSATASAATESENAAIEKAIEPDEEDPSSTPGAIVRLKVDNRHWLGYGYGETTTTLVDSNRIFPLLRLDQGTNIAITAPDGKMLLSGLMWDDVQQQLPNKSFVMHMSLGRGNIVAFTEDPNYRAFLESMSVMFLNAVLLGPGH